MCLSVDGECGSWIDMIDAEGKGRIVRGRKERREGGGEVV